MDIQTTKGNYKQGNTIKFETETIKSSLSDYSDAFTLVTGNVTVTADSDSNILLKRVTKTIKNEAKEKKGGF